MLLLAITSSAAWVSAKGPGLAEHPAHASERRPQPQRPQDAAAGEIDEVERDGAEGKSDGKDSV
jgi:hypothetical protein